MADREESGGSRRADIFFYGLFMDADHLRSLGVAPQRPEPAVLNGYELRIGERAALAPADGAQTRGVVMSMTLAEISRLYHAPSLEDYRPEAVLIELPGGEVTAALCYNLPQPPPPGVHDRGYAAKLREAALKVGLPPDYVASLD